MGEDHPEIQHLLKSGSRYDLISHETVLEHVPLNLTVHMLYKQAWQVYCRPHMTGIRKWVIGAEIIFELHTNQHPQRQFQNKLQN